MSVFKLLRAGTALALAGDGGTGDNDAAVGVLEIKRQSGELD